MLAGCIGSVLFQDVNRQAVALLQDAGCDVYVPRAQTCCGQPMANTGCTEDTRPVAEKFFHIFKDYQFSKDHQIALPETGDSIVLVRKPVTPRQVGRVRASLTPGTIGKPTQRKGGHVFRTLPRNSELPVDHLRRGER